MATREPAEACQPFVRELYFKHTKIGDDGSRVVDSGTPEFLADLWRCKKAVAGRFNVEEEELDVHGELTLGGVNLGPNGPARDKENRIWLRHQSSTTAW